MREYGRVAPTFWTRGSGKKLRGKPHAQLVALYLFTCPASSMIGIYHLALPTMAHELGMDATVAEQALVDVCSLGIAQYDADEELVYLPEGAKYQIGERLKAGDKRVAGIRFALAQLGGHRFVADFVRRYGADFCLSDGDTPPPTKRSELPPEAPSMPLPASTGSPFDAKQGSSKDQEQAEAQKTHTHRADAPAREDDPQGDALPMACAREDFAALLVTVDILAALAADAGLVTDLHSGFAMAHGGRATIALAQQAIAACMAREPLREMTPRQQRERLGSYLANQRRARDRESDRGLPSPSHPDVQHALAVFGEVWAAKKHETFVRGEGDEEHAAALVNLAKAHASKDLRGSAIVRHWAEEYLADAERFVADANHPLRLLPRRVGQYGVPKAPKPKKAPEPEPTFAKPPPGTLAAFKGATS